ncbi:hypothetical protein BKI52_04875 [marine bacterium AO1-C]|nr:hypothetical protein BKI52_04875 [marine bacterium AO1-C]
MLALKILFKEFYHLLQSKNGRRFLWLAFKKGAKTRFKPQSLKFAGFKLQIVDSLSFIWQVKEIFVDEAYHFSSKSATPIIYDCGANVGTSCLYFKKLYPQAKIKAIEADEKIAHILKANLLANNLNDVEVITKAVWKDNQGIEIALEGADGASIFGNANKQHIPSVRLKDLLIQEKYIDMLKMDIEGAEVEVIKDCADELSKIQHLFIEYHSYQNHIQDLSKILEILENQGFQYFIQNEQSLKSPLINHFQDKNQLMTLQLNIFAHKAKSK